MLGNEQHEQVGLSAQRGEEGPAEDRQALGERPVPPGGSDVAHGGEPGQPLVDHGPQDVVLALEVAIHQRVAHPGRPGQLAGGGRPVPALGEQPAGDLDDLRLARSRSNRLWCMI